MQGVYYLSEGIIWQLLLKKDRDSIIFHDLTAKYGIALCLKKTEGGLNLKKEP